MKKIYISYIKIFIFLFVVSSCEVDDYQDANPPRKKDGPAVYQANLAGDVITAPNLNEVQLNYVQAGKSFMIEVDVVDAPGMIDSVSLSLSDSLGTISVDEASFNAIKGKDQGKFVVNYTGTTSSVGTTAVENITIGVYDAQNPRKMASISPASVKVVENCLASKSLVGWYDTVASGYNSETDENYSGLTGKSELYIRANNGADNPWNYRLRNASFGLYADQGFGEPFANLAVCDNTITTGTPAPADGLQYTGTINEDGTLTISWSNEFGDTGTVTLTPGTEP
jgi:hypothetical protein